MKNPSVFAEYANYYDLLYKDKDYAGEVNYVDRLIRRWRPGSKSVMELGSGTGKHAILLTDRGYSVHGVERSSEMLAVAESRSGKRSGSTTTTLGPTFSQGDIRTARVSREFDVVISLFHVVGYQVTNTDVAAVLETARSHLQSGGIFIFDVWYGPAVLTDRPVVRVKRMSNDQIEVTRLAEPDMRPNENVVEVNYHVFIRNKSNGLVLETRETHPMRYFFRPEIEFFAAAAGFHCRHGEEWMTASALGWNTWGACFVLEAV